MNIAIDIRSTWPQPAGKGIYTLNIVKSLILKDENHTFFLLTDNDNQIFQGKNTKIIRLSSGLKWHFQAWQFIRKNKIQVYFSPCSFILPAVLPASVHTITTVHDMIAFNSSENHLNKASFIEKLFIKPALKKSDYIATVSSFTAKELHNRFPNLHLKTFYTPCAASEVFTRKTDSLAAFCKNTQLPAKFFLSVGSILPRKNYIRLIKAFSRFSKKHPDYHLIIVGKKLLDFDQVFDVAKNEKIFRNIHFLDYLSTQSLVNLYNLAEALVFPSVYEGFGIPALEAMQSGCPVLAANNTSLPEVVGNAGLLFDPFDLNDISNSLEMIILDQKLRAQLIELGLERSKSFSWSKTSDKILSVINEIS